MTLLNTWEWERKDKEQSKAQKMLVRATETKSRRKFQEGICEHNFLKLQAMLFGFGQSKPLVIFERVLYSIMRTAAEEIG